MSARSGMAPAGWMECSPAGVVTMTTRRATRGRRGGKGLRRCSGEDPVAHVGRCAAVHTPARGQAHVPADDPDRYIAGDRQRLTILTRNRRWNPGSHPGRIDGRSRGTSFTSVDAVRGATFALRSRERSEVSRRLSWVLGRLAGRTADFATRRQGRRSWPRPREVDGPRGQ